MDLARQAASLLQSREVAHLVEDAGGVQAQRRLICHGLRLGERLDRPQAPGAFDADETDALVTEPKGDHGAGARRAELGAIHRAEPLDRDTRLPRLAPEARGQRGGPSRGLLRTARDGEQSSAVGAHHHLCAFVGEHAAEAGECGLRERRLLEAAGELACYVAQGHEQTTCRVVVGALGRYAFAQVAGQHRAEPEGGTQREHDDDIDHARGQILADTQHGADDEHQCLDHDGRCQSGDAHREGAHDGRDGEVDDRRAVPGCGGHHDEGYGRCLGDEDGVAQPHRARRKRAELGEYGDERDERDLRRRHGRVSGGE